LQSKPSERCLAHASTSHKTRRDTLAREFQAQDLADEILEIADATSGDWAEKIGADGKAALDHENIARARRRINALGRQAARLAPKKYGSRR
jgi:polyhydroxyalkanoate synthesis regulator phasin